MVLDCASKKSLSHKTFRETICLYSPAVYTPKAVLTCLNLIQYLHISVQSL